MFVITRHSKPHTYKNNVEIILIDKKPTPEEIRRKFSADFKDYDISIAEVVVESDLNNAVFHVLDNIGWVDEKEAPKDENKTTLYAAFGGDRFVKFIISDSASKAVKKVTAYDDDPTALAVKVPNNILEALKKGKAFLIGTDILEENEKGPESAVQVDDEGCWWISDIEPTNTDWRVEELKLNRVIEDI